MKKLIAFTVLLGTFAASGTAFAADSMQRGTDWSGLTVGVIGTVAGGEDNWPGDGIYDLDTGVFGGAFVSYDYQIDNVVVGAAVKAQWGKMKETDYPEFFYTAFYDFNGRVGYAVNNALLYASGGLTIAGGEDDGLDFTSTGYNVGAGIDFQLTEKVVVGGEYTFRSLSDDCPHDLPFELSSHSFTAKIGYRF